MILYDADATEAYLLDGRYVVKSMKHAHWILDEEGDRHCSNCNAIVEADEWLNHTWYHCYHCGADMDLFGLNMD